MMKRGKLTVPNCLIPRLAAVQGTKWGDEVQWDSPYNVTVDVLDKHDCYYAAHGDDVSVNAQGVDCYIALRQAGRFIEYRRTDGISTTDLVERILERYGRNKSKDAPKPVPYFYSSKMFYNFSSGKEPKPTDKIVYVDGCFDLFHAGHMELFKKARESGDFLIVGVHEDSVIAEIRGEAPLMNLHERALSVLSCRYVDEVLIGAPYCVTKEFLTSRSVNASAVVHGKTPVHPDAAGNDPYTYPKSIGAYLEVETRFSYLTAEVIVERIFRNQDAFEERQRKKLKK